MHWKIVCANHWVIAAVDSAWRWSASVLCACRGAVEALPGVDALMEMECSLCAVDYMRPERQWWLTTNCVGYI